MQELNAEITQQHNNLCRSFNAIKSNTTSRTGLIKADMGRHFHTLQSIVEQLEAEQKKILENDIEQIPKTATPQEKNYFALRQDYKQFLKQTLEIVKSTKIQTGSAYENLHKIEDFSNKIQIR